MTLPRAHSAAIAAASDGSVLINVVELLPEGLMARLGQAIGGGHVFIGVPLDQSEAAEVVARLDGAAAEASARVLGTRASARPKAAKPGKARKARKAPGKRR